MQKDPYSLDRLRGIVEPAPVGWWPPAAFWYCVIAIIATWLIYAALAAICRWIRNAYRRQAVRELALLRASTGGDAPGWQSRATVSTILKRVALVSFPREQVASLTGNAWIQFLSDTCDHADFMHEPSSSIGCASFDRPAVDLSDSDLKRIIDDAQAWVIGHRAESPR